MSFTPIVMVISMTTFIGTKKEGASIPLPSMVN